MATLRSAVSGIVFLPLLSLLMATRKSAVRGLVVPITITSIFRLLQDLQLVVLYFLPLLSLLVATPRSAVSSCHYCLYWWLLQDL